ncbi:ATP-binding protein, partial [Anaerotignum sp.]|uniref:ATP-binding protein n=1 Tax=Anaerotignum sp. TaxID=2039241 RepID=UPI003FA41F05
EKDDERGIEQLEVPIWLWNTSEWVAFTQASSKAQKPTLVQALRTVRDGQIDYREPRCYSMRRFLRTLVGTIGLEFQSGSPWGRFPQPKAFYEKISKWRGELEDDASFSQPQKQALQQFRDALDGLITARNAPYSHMDFTRTEVHNLLSFTRSAHQAFGGNDQDVLPIDADVPRPFSGDTLLRSIEANAELMNTSVYVETMLMRVKTLLSDAKLKPVISTNEQITLDQWMDKYICPSNCTEGSIVIVDLSLIPAELTHIITSVLARMTLESLQRYRKINDGQTIPTTLVMEEAHTFIKRYNTDSENGNASEMCSKVFEKIAREGRKFGLGLILSSQRPSELSPTVLSQCNSFLLHRISNDRDQELVSKFVPDTLRGLLRELPSLPSRNAILLGWASELPVMVKMNFLKEQSRPQSNDPEYWDVWTEGQRTVQWKTVADNWQESEEVPPAGQLDTEEELPF